MKYSKEQIEDWLHCSFEQKDAPSWNNVMRDLLAQNERYRAALEKIRDEGEPSDWYELVIQELKGEE